MSMELARQTVATIAAVLSATADSEAEGEDVAVQEEEQDDVSWYSRVSIRVLTAVNGVSMFFALLSIAVFIVAWRRSKTPHMFNRPSVKLVIATALADTLFHTSYIYSLYTQTEITCQIANFGVVFGALLGIFYVSCLAINLSIIAFSKYGGATLRRVFPYLLVGSFVFALVVSTLLVCFTKAVFSSIDGCWFREDDIWTVFACYFVWLCGMSVLNLVLSIAIYIRLKKHAKEMQVLLARNVRVFDSLASKDVKSVRPSTSHGEHTLVSDLVAHGDHKLTIHEIGQSIAIPAETISDPSDIVTTSPEETRRHTAITIAVPAGTDAHDRRRDDHASANHTHSNTPSAVRGGRRPTPYVEVVSTASTVTGRGSLSIAGGRERTSIASGLRKASSSVVEHLKLRKTPKEGDELILILPFFTEIWWVISFFFDISDPFLDMVQSVAQSSKGLLMFAVVLQDPALKGYFQNVFKK
ncbi:hypothetical protein HDU96_011057 [Phlyctochytrium bullatum]|nr:hypothetical protein HDU96_011057 [Phlyctochytrium bullatum]